MQHHWPKTLEQKFWVWVFTAAGPGPVADPGPVCDPGASVCQCETDRRTGRRGRTGRTHCWETGLMRKDEDFFFPPLSSDSFYVCLQIRILKLSESVCVLVFFLSCFNLLKKCYTSQRRHLVLLLWWFTVGVWVVLCPVGCGLQTSDFLTCKQMFVKSSQRCFHLNVTTDRTAVAQSVFATVS